MRIYILITFGCAIRKGPSSKLFELHYVACKSAGLVREYEFDLAEFFVQVRGLDSCRHVLVLIVHRHVVGDEHSLEEFHNLQGNQEGNGDKVPIEIIMRALGLT
jgi:hypothetical protein